MNFRNITLVAVGTLLVIGFGIALYFYLHGSNTTPSDQTGDLPRGSVNQNVTGAGEVRTPEVGNGGVGDATGATAEPVLFQIHDKPIVSAATFTRSTGSVVRFMEQGSGNVYEYHFASKQKRRVSNTSIPHIGRAVWSRDGSVVAFQYVEDDVVHTAVGYLSATSTESDGPFEKIFFFPENIRSLALSPSGTQLAYVTSIDGSGAVFVSNSNGTSPKLLMASPLSQWNVSWPTADYAIVSSAFGDVGGISYRVDIPSGKKTVLLTSARVFSGVLGGTNGKLIAPNPKTGGVALYDATFGTFSKLFIPTWLDKCSVISSATSSMVCAIVPSSVFAEHVPWSRGEFASNDSLATINFADNYIQLLIPEKEFGDKRFDMVNVLVSPDKKFALFKNRIDGFLWGVRSPYTID